MRNRLCEARSNLIAANKTQKEVAANITSEGSEHIPQRIK